MTKRLLFLLVGLGISLASYAQLADSTRSGFVKLGGSASGLRMVNGVLTLGSGTPGAGKYLSGTGVWTTLPSGSLWVNSTMFGGRGDSTSNLSINTSYIARKAYVDSLVAAKSGSGGSSSTYSVSIKTTAGIQAGIDAVSSYGTVTLQPGDYDLTAGAINFGGKTNVIIQGYQTANFKTGAGSLIVVNGANKGCRFTGINFYNTGNVSGVGNGLIQFTPQGTQTNWEIDHCYFTSPNYCTNGTSINTYNAVADGGNGTGNLFQGLNYHDNIHENLGRMGWEALCHTWNDGKTDVYLKDIIVSRNIFRNTGTKAEPNGTINGMAASISGYSWNVEFTTNNINDANLLGLEMAGTLKGVISGNTIDYVNNSFTGISVSDNAHNATRYITINGNSVRSKYRCLNMNQVKEFGVTGNTFVHNPSSSTNAINPVYFQACYGGTLTGGTIEANSYNPVRLDDTSNMIIGGGIRIKNNDTNGYSLVSIYGNSGTGNGSFNNIVGSDIFGEKYNGATTTGLAESYGNVNNNSGIR